MEDNIQQEAAIEAPVEQAENVETFNAQQVADIVKREKIRAKEAALREAEARYKQEMEQMQGQQPQGQMGEVPPDQAVEDKLYARFMSELQAHQEKMEKEAQEAELKTLANQYHLKVGKGSKMFDDFNEIMADFDPAAFPELVMATMQMSGDSLNEVLYELAKHPQKVVELDSLLKRSPKMAERQLEKLVKSAQGNIEAKQNNVEAPAPLSRLKSSSAGADNGNLSVKDFKNMPWLKG